MILVTGATGNVGQELVSQLLEQGQSVRVLTRDPRKAAIWGDRVACTQGSFEEPETLKAALQGVDQLFLMTNEIGAEHVQTMMRAVQGTEVRNIVYLSSTGAGHPELIIGKWHIDREEAIRASGLSWTFLRPGNFMSNALMWAETIKTQGVVYSPSGEGRTAPIDPRDIATVAALALTTPDHVGKIYELTGEEALTAEQQTEILALALGKPLRCIDVPPAAFREQMVQRGLPPLVADATAEIFALIREGWGGTATDTFAQVVGRKPRAFEAWCRDHIAAFQ